MRSNVVKRTTRMYAPPDKLRGHNIIHTGRTQNHLQNNSTLDTEPNEVVTTSEPQLPTAVTSLKDSHIALTRTPHASTCMYRQNRDASGLAPSIRVPTSDTTDPIQVITSAPPVTPAAADAGSMRTEMDQTSPDLKLGTRNIEGGHRNVQHDPNEPLVDFDQPSMPSNEPASPSERSRTHSEAREWLRRPQRLSSRPKQLYP
ncbi:hypothetical protein BKA83DRAFT_4357011 [Pisolithus microcarpus]|nr:hypothetical protein BKA83DRAFT_4357011 [Pisolithus microcarpus]